MDVKKFGDRGAVLVLVAILLFFLMGVAALAIDLGHLYMVRNELQNAADAGALAGAANLYVIDPVTNIPSVNPDANQMAWQAATANRATAKEAGADGSKYQPVDIRFSPDNAQDGDILRGHWGFRMNPKFTRNDSLLAFSQETLWNSTFDELDQNTDLINAVKVTVRREANPVSAFFSGIFGLEDFLLSASAVAYLGHVNTINPGEIDLPLAVCRETITSGGQLKCNFSRLINSSSKEDANTGGWTNFSQDTEYWAPDGCHNPNTSEVAGHDDNPTLVCGGGNPKPVVVGVPMGVNGGAMEPVFSALRDCWNAFQAANMADPDIGRPMPMKVTVPVVECGNSEGKVGNANGPCLPTFPPVKLEIIWVSPKTWPEPQKWDFAPQWMDDFDMRTEPDGSIRWNEFVKHFELVNPAGDSANADYYTKTIYAKPSCEEMLPMGTTGGTVPGPLADTPVLVE